jgi:hypothetical protein
MKTALIAPLVLLMATACSAGSDTKAPAGEAGGAGTNSAQEAAIAANTRPDGSVIDESKPHEHTPENAHPEPMDMQ